MNEKLLQAHKRAIVVAQSAAVARTKHALEEANLMEKLLVETTNDYEGLLAERNQLRAALAAREAEVGRLVKALKEFGDHDVRCDYRDTWLEPQPKPCNCGLVDALADHTP